MSSKILLCLLLAVSCSVLSVSSLITANPTISAQSLRKAFDVAKPYADLSSAFYSIKGLQLIGENVLSDSKDAKEVCDLAKSKVDKTNLESIYYATSLAALVPNCPLDTASFQSTLANGYSSKSVADLYYLALISENLKIKIDSLKLSKSLTEALKSDSSIVNQGFSLHIAALLNENNKIFYESIEDILDQADEVDKKFLQYEGGVGTTSIVLEGILALSEKFNKLPAKFNQQTITKFINYLTSKRFPTNIKSAFFLLKATIKFSDNKLAVPLVLNRLSPIGVSLSQSNLLVSVTTLNGGAVKSAQINIDALSATSSSSKSIFNNKKAFTAKSSDRTSFEVKLIEANQQVLPDFYMVTVALNLKPEEKQFFLTENKVEVKATTLVNVVDIVMGVSDRDVSVPNLIKFEQKVQKLDADQQSKFIIKFTIKEKSKNSAIEAHQTFVKFTEVKSGREIIYLAEAGLNKQYSAEIDFYSNVKNFNYQSGLYSVDLIVSDPLFENPELINLSELKIKFSEEKPASDKPSLFGKKTEIKHLFREPEPRPPVAFSSLFAGLCLLPLGLMLVLWMKIGFNFSKFSLSLPAIVFHLGLAAIFGLFYCYWVKLNMFQTIRYLAFIGLVVIISGNKLLKSLASSNKEKKSN